MSIRTVLARRPTGPVKLLAAAAATCALVVAALASGVGAGADPPEAGAAAHTGHTLWQLLLAIVAIVIAARLCGGACRRIGQPRVVGEIAAGILLGPSLVGALAPGVTAAVFPADVAASLGTIAQLGLVLFMFVIGLELDGGHLRGRGHLVVTISHVSIVVPFVLGLALASVLYDRLAPPGTAFAPFALFLGASMSITAFPVLARILSERGLAGTPLGGTALSCAAVDDVTAWCLLAVVVAVTRATDVAGAAVTIALSLAFVAAMALVVRPVLEHVAGREERRGALEGATLAAMLVGALLSAFATERIGIHAIFGAFLFGAVTPASSLLARQVRARIEDLTVILLLPVFFAHTGMRTEIGLLGADAGLWLLCGLVIAVAVVGKWGGSTLAARALGMSRHDSLALGVLMNTRGLTELVILDVGLDLGVISPALFAMLVLMALVTTSMAAPLLALIGRIERPPRVVTSPPAPLGGEIECPTSRSSAVVSPG